MSQYKPPSLKEVEKRRKAEAKEKAAHDARVKAHHKRLAKEGSGARWPS